MDIRRKDKRKYIVLREAAKISGYSSDYIGFLIREGKIKGKRVYSKFAWRVSPQEIIKYCQKTGKNLDIRDSYLLEKEYLSLKEAAKISGYSPDYIGSLLRKREIHGKLRYSSPKWVITEEEIRKYREKIENKQKTPIKKIFSYIVSLKPRSFFLTNWRFVLIVILLLVIGIGPVKIFQKITGAFIEERETLNFYSTVCDGDWQNPKNAQGEPEVGPDGDFELFSETNSAVYKNGSLSLICEKFTPKQDQMEKSKISNPLENPLSLDESGLEILSLIGTTTPPLDFVFLPIDLASPPIDIESVTPPVETTTPPTESVTFPDDDNVFQSAKIKFSFAIGEKSTEFTPMLEEPAPEVPPIETVTPPTSFLDLPLQPLFAFKERFLKTIQNFTEKAKILLAKVKDFFGALIAKVKTILPRTILGVFVKAEEIPLIETVTPPQEVIIPEHDLETEPVESGLPQEGSIETTTPPVETVTPPAEAIPDVLPDLDAKIIIWYSVDGENWQQLDTISSYASSNALNNGYFSYDAPFLENWEDVRNLKIKFEGVVGGESTIMSYLDSVWVEVTYKEREEREPGEIEFISKKKDFKANEEPEFRFRYKKSGDGLLTTLGEKLGFVNYWENINTIVQVVNPKGEIFDTPPFILLESDGEFLVKLNCQNFAMQNFGGQPGVYKIILKIEDEGITQEFEQDFTWGLLAINVNKSIYISDKEQETSDTAYIQMAALRDDGHTICNANLQLKITSPDGKVTNPRVQKSGECGPNNVTDLPDYFTYYQVAESGEYVMKLKNLDTGYEIEDSFEVRESVPFDIERIGPTRIWPLAPYEMKLKIKANQDFEGQIIENVPGTFDIKSVSITDYQILSIEEDKRIIFDVDWQMGESHKFSYQFDAPDISPYLYLIGPLSFTEVGSVSATFEEVRKWQIAADAIEKENTATPVDFNTANPTISLTFTDADLIVVHVMTKDGTAATNVSDNDGNYTLAHSSGDTGDPPRVETWYLANPTSSGTSWTEENCTISDSDYLCFSGKACTGVGTNPNCMADACDIGACPARANASGSPSGCSLSPANGWSCACVASECQGESGSCTVSGTCSYTCDTGYYNCDGDDSNGCESSTKCPKTITVTVSQCEGILGAFGLTGTNTSSPIGATADNTGSGTSATSTITTSYNNSWIISAIGGDYDETLGQDGSQTSIWEEVVGGTPSGRKGAEATYELKATAGQDTQSWTLGGTENWAINSVEVRYSPPTIDVSGNAYEDEGTTVWSGCDSSTQNVALYIEGATSTTSCATSTGAFTFSNVTSPSGTGTPLIIWFDGETDNYGSNVNRYSGSGPVTSVKVRRNRVIVQHDDSGPVTNSDMDTWDNDNDTDINYYVTSSNSTVESGSKLIVNSSDTYDPGGTITTNATGGDFHIDDSATAYIDTSTSTIGKDILVDANATLHIDADTNINGGYIATGDSATVDYSASPAVTISGTGSIGGGTSPSITFYDLTISATQTIASAIDVDHDLTVNGTMQGTNNVTVNWDIAGTGTINMTGGTVEQRVGWDVDFGTTSGTSTWTFSNLKFSNSDTSAYTITTQSGGSGTIEVTGTLTIGLDTDSATSTLAAADRTWILSGTGTPLSISSTYGDLDEDTSTFNYTGDGGAIITAETYYNLQTGNATTQSATSTYTLGASLTVSNILTIGPTSGSYIHELEPGSCTLTLSGSGTPFVINSNGSFTPSSSTVKYLNNNSGAANVTAATYNNLEILPGSGGVAQTETIRPDGSGSECNAPSEYNCSACPNHYTCVDEATADGDGTGVGSGYDTWYRDLYSIENPTASSGSIDNVTVYIVCRKAEWGSAIASANPAIKSGSQVDEGIAKNLTTSYQTYSFLCENDPDGGSCTIENPWTWSAIDSIEAGQNIRGNWLDESNNAVARCTQVYVKVNYFEPTYNLGTDASQTITTNGYLTIGDGTNEVTVNGDTYNPDVNVSGDLTISASATLDAGSGTWDLSNSGTPFVINGTFNAQTSTFKYTASVSEQSGWSESCPSNTSGTCKTEICENPCDTGADCYQNNCDAETTCLTKNNASKTNNCGGPSGSCLCVFDGICGYKICQGEAATCTYTGTCDYTCDSGYYNCDDNVINGCESPSPCVKITATTYNNLELLPSANGVAFALGTTTGQTINTNGYLIIGNGTNTGIITAVTYDPNLNIDGNLTISASATLTASDSTSTTFTVAGSWSNSGTFTHSSGTVTFDAASTGKTISDGGSPFYDITFTGINGGWTYTDGASTAPNQTTVSATSGVVTYINAKTGTVSVTNGTLNVDWYLGIHIVDAAATSTNVNTQADAITISEANSNTTVWQHNGDWGTPASSKTTETDTTGKNPQPTSTGAIRIREYSMTDSSTCNEGNGWSGCTLYQYNLQIDWVIQDSTNYGEYDYYADQGNKYITSCWAGTSSSCEDDSSNDDVIGELWYRSDAGTMWGSKDYDGLDEPPDHGSWYCGMFKGLEVTITGTSIDLGELNPSNNFTATAATTTDITVTTSATNGYIVTAWESQLMTCSDTGACGSETIQNFTQGTYANPDPWGQDCPDNSTYCGFGFTSSDPSVEGSNRYGVDGDPNGSEYTYFPNDSSNPVRVMDYSDPVSGQSYSITYKISASPTQRAGPYTTTIIYIVTPQY